MRLARSNDGIQLRGQVESKNKLHEARLKSQVEHLLHPPAFFVYLPHWELTIDLRRGVHARATQRPPISLGHTTWELVVTQVYSQ